jgi:hypothetical protein
MADFRDLQFRENKKYEKLQAHFLIKRTMAGTRWKKIRLGLSGTGATLPIPSSGIFGN